MGSCLIYLYSQFEYKALYNISILNQYQNRTEYLSLALLSLLMDSSLLLLDLVIYLERKFKDFIKTSFLLLSLFCFLYISSGMYLTEASFSKYSITTSCSTPICFRYPVLFRGSFLSQMIHWPSFDSDAENLNTW